MSKLHPNVDVAARGDSSIELFDRRTTFRVVIDGVARLAQRDATVDDPNLLHALDELGLLDGDLTDREVRVRQHRFLQNEAWDERLARMREFLAFATENVAFYRSKAAAYDPSTLSAREDVHLIPFMRKADLRASFVSLCNERCDIPSEIAAGRLELVATSGTTGDRVQCLSDSTLVRIPSNYDQIWGVPRIAETPRTAVLTSATCMTSACTLGTPDTSARLVHDYTLYLPALRDPFAITRQEVETVAGELSAFRPHFLFVNPVYAHALARSARRFGIDLPAVSVVVTSYQFASFAQRRALARAFRAPVRSLYAATELGGCQVGLECHAGRLHVREDHCLVELLAKNGRPSAGTDLGMVVVSTLVNRVVPLVRYVLGDLASQTGEPCTCPLSDWPSISVHGRLSDSLFVGGRWFTAREVDEVTRTFRGIDFYCCRQVAEAAIEVDVVPSDEEVDEESLARRFERLFEGASVRVRLTTSLAPSPSLKYPTTSREVAAPEWFS
jgi:phenylacetate-coenzyme A ligase PaaK-like adenylate-forming protein